MPPSITREEALVAFDAARREHQDFLATIPSERMTEPGATGPWSVKDVIELVDRGYPMIGELIRKKKVLVSVNQEIAHEHTAVGDGDEVALLPPFAGGGATEQRLDPLQADIHDALWLAARRPIGVRELDVHHARHHGGDLGEDPAGGPAGLAEGRGELHEGGPLPQRGTERLGPQAPGPRPPRLLPPGLRSYGLRSYGLRSYGVLRPGLRSHGVLSYGRRCRRARPFRRVRHACRVRRARPTPRRSPRRSACARGGRPDRAPRCAPRVRTPPGATA